MLEDIWLYSPPKKDFNATLNIQGCVCTDVCTGAPLICTPGGWGKFTNGQAVLQGTVPSQIPIMMCDTQLSGVPILHERKQRG